MTGERSRAAEGKTRCVRTLRCVRLSICCKARSTNHESNNKLIITSTTKHQQQRRKSEKNQTCRQARIASSLMVSGSHTTALGLALTAPSWLYENSGSSWKKPRSRQQEASHDLLVTKVVIGTSEHASPQRRSPPLPPLEGAKYLLCSPTAICSAGTARKRG